MAMRSCPECLNQIDETESVCPHCGHVLFGDEPNNNGAEVYLQERRWTFGNTVVALLLVLLIAGVGYLLYIYGLKIPYEDATSYYEQERSRTNSRFRSIRTSQIRFRRPTWNWMLKSPTSGRSSIPEKNRWTPVRRPMHPRWQRERRNCV